MEILFINVGAKEMLFLSILTIGVTLSIVWLLIKRTQSNKTNKKL